MGEFYRSSIGPRANHGVHLCCGYTALVCDQARSTPALHPSAVAKSSTNFTGVKAGMSPLLLGKFLWRISGNDMISIVVITVVLVQPKCKEKSSVSLSWRAHCSWLCWTATPSTILHNSPRPRLLRSSSTSRFSRQR